MKLEHLKDINDRAPVIVSYGGGTDSTAMILACHERNVPIDLILFADTGGEKPHTYEMLDKMDQWLKKNGYSLITRVKKKKALYDAMMEQKKLPAVVFGRKDCSWHWKILPQRSFLKKWQQSKDAWAQGKKVISLIGYDANESRRAKKTEDDQFVYMYPLIEWQLTRDNCIALIEKHGLQQPGKSSCYFCPMNKKKDILELYNKNPELMTNALKLEKNAVLNGTVKGLGRGYKWQSLIDDYEYTSKLATLFDEEMPCGCYDGD